MKGFGEGSLDSFEWPMPALSLLLTVIGVLLIYSAVTPMGETGRQLVIKQITWCSLGIVLMASVLLVDYSIIERWAVPLFAAAVLALIAVWAIGKVSSGSKRWIEMGFMRIQPSEFAKLAVVVMLAKVLHEEADAQRRDPRHLVKAAVVVIVPGLLIAVQPDLGTAGALGLISLSVVLFAGVSRRVLLWGGGAMVLALPVLVAMGDRLLMEYQKKRLMTFFNPELDPTGAGYHILQSRIAIGSGGLLGKGYLEGTQNQLMFLPVKHTDFIFSILAEEFGFVGCMVVLALFAALFLRGISIAGRARDSFGALLAFGCTAILFWHVIINVGMVMGLLPVVGVPLTFMSYGGSSLLVSFLSVSLIANVSMRRFSY